MVDLILKTTCLSTNENHINKINMDKLGITPLAVKTAVMARYNDEPIEYPKFSVEDDDNQGLFL